MLVNSYIEDSNGNFNLFFSSKIPFPERIRGKEKLLSLKSQDDIDDFNRFIADFDLEFPKSKFSNKILNAACFLYDQSYWAPVETLCFMVCIIGLESLMVAGKSEASYQPISISINGIIKNIEETDIKYARELLRKVIFKILDINISQ